MFNNCVYCLVGKKLGIMFFFNSWNWGHIRLVLKHFEVKKTTVVEMSYTIAS